MSNPLIYADFNKPLDGPNQLNLDCFGSAKDLTRLGYELNKNLPNNTEDVPVTFYTDDADDNGQSDNLLVDGRLQYKDGKWVGIVDWDTLRHESDGLN